MDKSSAKMLIRTTVVELMETTDIPDITVTAVCKRSNLSRTTFYRYYPSVDAVVKEMGDDLLASIRRTQEIDRRTQGLGGMRKTGTSDLIRAQILYEYGPFIRVVTGVHGDPSFAYKAVAVIRERLQEEVGSLGLIRMFSSSLCLRGSFGALITGLPSIRTLLQKRPTHVKFP